MRKFSEFFGRLFSWAGGYWAFSRIWSWFGPHRRVKEDVFVSSVDFDTDVCDCDADVAEVRDRHRFEKRYVEEERACFGDDDFDDFDFD